MAIPVVPARFRRAGAVVGVLAVLVVLVLSHSFGRAVPTNNYRPLLPADAIESGCYPLPGDVRLDGLSYQVRWDEDVETTDGERRHLRGQYNLVGRAEAERLLVAAFTAAGFRESRAGATEGERVLRKPGEGVVRLEVTELPDTSAETLVRGEFLLDLPVAELAKDAPACRRASSTKRWGEDAG